MNVVFLRPTAVAALASAVLLASAAGAQAAISVTDAKVEAGKLVVTGAASSGAQIRLDGQESAAFNAKAGIDGAFSFSLVYHPGDCVVTVEALIPPYLTTGESTDALVANCGRDGVTARGEWSSSAGYVVNDLATHDGSTWRARRNNAGRTPSAGADWEVFAAAGESMAEAAERGSLRVPPTGPAGGDLQGNYPNPTIRNLVIEASNLVDNAVTNLKINNGAVDSSKVANDTLTADDLAVASVTSLEIAAAAVGPLQIATDAVTSFKIATGAVGSSDLATQAVRAEDIATGAVGAAAIATDAVGQIEIGNSAVGTSEIRSNSVDSDRVINGSLTAEDLATDAVAAAEIADNSIDGGEVIDFGLTNQDVGVLFAEVNADATLANSSGSVTVSNRAGAGTYDVDFGRNLSSCTAVATVGNAGVFSQMDGTVIVSDAAGNAEGVFVNTNDTAGANADLPFRLVVVC